MKISQLKTHIIKEHNSRINAHNERMAILEMLPESLDVSSAYLDTVHLNAAPYADNMKTLHQIRLHCGNYKLDWYGAVKKESLALKYAFEGFDLFMHCNDPEHALKIVSNGKCKFAPTKEIIEASPAVIREGVTVVCEVA